MVEGPAGPFYLQQELLFLGELRERERERTTHFGM